MEMMNLWVLITNSLSPRLNCTGGIFQKTYVAGVECNFATEVIANQQSPQMCSAFNYGHGMLTGSVTV